MCGAVRYLAEEFRCIVINTLQKESPTQLPLSGSNKRIPTLIPAGSEGKTALCQCEHLWPEVKQSILKMY